MRIFAVLLISGCLSAQAPNNLYPMRVHFDETTITHHVLAPTTFRGGATIVETLQKFRYSSRFCGPKTGSVYPARWADSDHKRLAFLASSPNKEARGECIVNLF
jgi:hypothetical protein